MQDLTPSFLRSFRDVVEVVAGMHLRKDPAYWKPRTVE